MKVLVTGASGFIGSNISARLLEQGHAVRGFDVTPCDMEGIESITGDITSEAACRAACDGVDAVIHGVSIHHIEKVASGPLRVLDVNVAGTLNVLRNAVQCEVKKFVYLSSAKIYGEPGGGPSSEDDLPQPIEIYALSKVAGEHYCHLIHEAHGLDVSIVRPFSVYGPSQSLNTGYVGMLLESVITGRPLQLPGEPGFTRDFVHVSDVVDLCIRVASDSKQGLRIFNAGSGSFCSLTDLVKTANRALGMNLRAGYQVPRPETIQRTHADMTAASAQLGFEPQVSLNDGLRQTLEWFTRSGARGNH